MVAAKPTDWKHCFLDRWFYLILIVGPLVWLTLLLTGLATGFEQPAATVLVFGVLVYPILEEIVFRGALQGWLLGIKGFSHRICPGITMANIVVSVVFSLFHLINQPPVWAALVFLPSMIFGWARDRYGSIVASIILHTFYNAGFLLLVFR